MSTHFNVRCGFAESFFELTIFYGPTLQTNFPEELFFCRVDQFLVGRGLVAAGYLTGGTVFRYMA